MNSGQIVRPTRTEGAGDFQIEGVAARRAFDRASKRYGAPALIGDEIARRMGSRLDLVRISPGIVLDAGCGMAPAKRWIGGRYSAAEFINLDWSLEMLLGTRRAMGYWQRFQARLRGQRQYSLCADLRSIPLADKSVDLIWSNLALTWGDPIEKAFQEFARVLRPGGLLMFSTYGPETLCELRSAFIDARLPGRVYSFSDMHDLGDALVAAGFSAPVMDMEKLKVSHANTQSLLQDLRRSGEVNSLEQRNRGLTGKRRFHRALDLLATGSTDGRINTTFEIVYGHAWKGPDRFKQDGNTSFAAPIKWSPRRA